MIDTTIPSSPELISLGGLILPLDESSDMRRVSVDLDGTSLNDFTSFSDDDGVYSVPTDILYLVGKISFATDRRLSMRFGYADDAIGTSFVELIDESILSPENNYSNNSDFVFSIPANKFPIINNTAAITSGFMILEGVQRPEEPGVGSAKLPTLPRSINIDAQQATNSLLKTIITNTAKPDIKTSATINTVLLNSSTSVKVADLNTSREYISISNEGPGTVFVKLQAASIDDTKKGDIVESGETWWMTPGYIYTGEISAIAKNTSPSVHVTEY